MSTGSDLVPEFMDAGFGNDIEPLLSNHTSTVEASPTPSIASLWDETYHIQASRIRSINLVMSTEPGKLALASPRPNAEGFILLEQERNDSGFEDFGVDGSDTDKLDTAEESSDPPSPSDITSKLKSSKRLCKTSRCLKSGQFHTRKVEYHSNRSLTGSRACRQHLDLGMHETQPGEVLITNQVRIH